MGELQVRLQQTSKPQSSKAANSRVHPFHSSLPSPGELLTQVFASPQTHEMDKVPQCGNLYIGSLEALDQPDLLEQKKITHILSMLEFDYCDYEEFDEYRRLLIAAEDNSKQDLYSHFGRTNAFIEEGLARGAVLVHCAMGQSTSAAVVCAYIVYKHRVSPSKALGLLREARQMAKPDKGFMEQLGTLARMLHINEDD